MLRLLMMLLFGGEFFCLGFYFGGLVADGGRMNATMERLAKMGEGEYSAFVRVLFGLSSPGEVGEAEVGEVEWVDPMLNQSQKDAIRFALAAGEIALIHGPPGVGGSLHISHDNGCD